MVNQSHFEYLSFECHFSKRLFINQIDRNELYGTKIDYVRQGLGGVY